KILGIVISQMMILSTCLEYLQGTFNMGFLIMFSLHAIALSTTTTEYMYISKSYKEAIWSRGLYNKLLRDYILCHFIRDVIAKGDNVTVAKIHLKLEFDRNANASLVGICLHIEFTTFSS
ncbi:hypothetical protein ACJX0J_029063, partial [Zea mays]